MLAVANWQRSKDGTKGTNKPKPLPRPSDKRQAADKAEMVRASIELRRQTTSTDGRLSARGDRGR